MSDARLEDLAHAAGLAVHWTDADGRAQRVAPEVLRSVLQHLGIDAQSETQVETSLAAMNALEHARVLPPLLTADAGAELDLGAHFSEGLAWKLIEESGQEHSGRLDSRGCLALPPSLGYARLQIAEQELSLALAPARACSVADLAGNPQARLWGLSAQLYSLRREGDGGLGDCAALEILIHEAAARGADAIAISPTHAMFAALPEQYSPYSPSSRLFFNPLYSAAENVLGEFAVRQAIADAGVADELARLEALPLIDWPAVARCKTRMLRALHAGFRRGGNPFQEDFSRFRARGGDALEQHCRFEALHGQRVAAGQPHDWREWPEELRDPASPALQRFAAEHPDEIEYHAFAQWLADRGLYRCQSAARSCGMQIGLIADLAVGADGAGSQAWSRQAELLPSLSVGAPPDILNRAGQNWGISAFSPQGLRKHGYRAFIEMLRRGLAHAGGLRIDHAMGLSRLWLIPPGAGPREGAYLSYPFEDLLRLIALESHRHRALILGEDLGTVAEGFRERMSSRGILGMRVLLFEQQDNRFTPPGEWPGDAMATTSTHDLPPLAGWFDGVDLKVRAELGEINDEQLPAAFDARERDAQALCRSLGQVRQTPPAALLDAAVEFVGVTPAPLVLLPLEDACVSPVMVNLPGTLDEHPNWRRRWSLEPGALLDSEGVHQRLARLASARCLAEKSSS
ncbi:4-alpha-glucanotransferase [Pseudomonas mangrovi]|uniref:4-alpha-glucanotransferase n=1 Tax=Pseudomonas mangrovi TaxID=2161748 RepID=A0A2T5P7L5_9PSED|nr:4-alpha-glucanotransferase [Pseudomonas mangrovi]PTU73726.1 4-alpha-glucanotransferase [Pseudomonas mangrovi]